MWQVSQAGRIRVPEDWTLTPRRTRCWPDLVLWHLVAGYGKVRTPDAEYSLVPGTCLVLRGGEAYTFSHESEHPFAHYWVHCHRLGSKRPTPPLPWRVFDDPRFFEMLLDRLIHGYLRHDSSGDSTRSWLEVVLEELHETDRRAAMQAALSLSQADRNKVDEICDRINENPASRWTVESLADRYGVSRSHFYRIFRLATGAGPQQYIINARMRWARSMLLDSDNPVTRIADYLGYSDVYFFSRQFKRQHGVGPRAFREAGYQSCSKSSLHASCSKTMLRDKMSLSRSLVSEEPN